MDVNDGGRFEGDVDHVVDAILIKVVKVKVMACWKVQGDFLDWFCPKSSKCWRWQNPY